MSVIKYNCRNPDWITFSTESKLIPAIKESLICGYHDSISIEKIITQRLTWLVCHCWNAVCICLFNRLIYKLHGRRQIQSWLASFIDR